MKHPSKAYSLLLAAAFPALLTACGGGGSDGGAPPVTVTPTPTPVTPTPTQYDLAFEPARARTLTGSGVFMHYKVENETNFIYLDAQRVGANAVSFQHTPTPVTETLTFDGVPAVFTAADYPKIDDGAYEYARYSRGDSERLIFGYLTPQYQYMIVVRHISEHWPVGGAVATIMDRRAVLGTQTLPRDVPTRGTANYQSTGYFQTAAVDFSGQSTVAVNWSARSLSGNFTANEISPRSGTTPRTATINFTGQIDPTTKAISGTVNAADGSYAGTATGFFYGPNAVEMGIIYVLQRNDGTRAVGVIVGRAS
jgi:hypothetical protein